MGTVASFSSGLLKIVIIPRVTAQNEHGMAASEAAGGTPETFDPARAEEYRAYLMRYALLQLRDPTAAEDAVQETLLAALQTASRFAGRSSVKTWLVGILKHKIIDTHRRQAREQPFARPEGDETEPDIAD